MLKYNKQTKIIERVETFTLPTPDETIWYNIENKSFQKTFDTIIEQLQIHPLAQCAMEDLVNFLK